MIGALTDFVERRTGALGLAPQRVLESPWAEERSDSVVAGVCYDLFARGRAYRLDVALLPEGTLMNAGHGKGVSVGHQLGRLGEVVATLRPKHRGVTFERLGQLSRAIFDLETWARLAVGLADADGPLGTASEALVVGQRGTIVDCGEYRAARCPELPDWMWGNVLLFERPPRHLEELRAWLEDFAAEHPEAGHVALSWDGDRSEVVAGACLETPDLEARSATVLTGTAIADLGAPPEGITVRRLSGDADWAALEALDRRIARPATIPVAQALDFARRKLAWHRSVCESGGAAWFGAFAGEAVVSAAGVHVGEGADRLARCPQAMPAPQWRGQGLIGHVLQTGSEVARHELGARRLVVVAPPHAVAAYQRAGLAPVGVMGGVLRRPKP